MKLKALRSESAPAWFPPVVVTAFLVVVAFGAVHHEMWRDEVRALSIARDGLPNLLQNLKNEGHPVLWYIVLRATLVVFGGSSLALPFASAAIAAAAVWVVCRFAPFPLWMRATFAFGVFPAYEYAVMSRNYGLGMLLLFAYCAIVSSEKPRRIQRGIALALLANSSVHALVLAAALLAAWVVEEFRSGAWKADPGTRRTLAVGVFVALCGFALAVVTTLPDADSVVDPSGELLPAKLVRLGLTLLSPGGMFSEAFLPNPFHWSPTVLSRLVDVLLVTVAVIVWDRRAIVLAHVIAVLGLSALFILVYPGAFRHQGMEVVFIIAILWLWRRAASEETARWRLRGASWVLAISLPIHVVRAATSYKLDFSRPLSAAPELARWLSAQPRYRDAIIVGEPDFLVEALPYSDSHRMYLWRENRYARWTHITAASRPHESLGALLDSAVALQVRERAPVLLVLGEDVDLRTDSGLVVTSYHRTFAWSPREREQFLRGARFVMRFPDAHTQERYAVYELRSAGDSR